MAKRGKSNSWNAPKAEKTVQEPTQFNRNGLISIRMRNFAAATRRHSSTAPRAPKFKQEYDDIRYRSVSRLKRVRLLLLRWLLVLWLGLKAAILTASYRFSRKSLARIHWVNAFIDNMVMNCFARIARAYALQSREFAEFVVQFTGKPNGDGFWYLVEGAMNRSPDVASACRKALLEFLSQDEIDVEVPFRQELAMALASLADASGLRDFDLSLKIVERAASFPNIYSWKLLDYLIESVPKTEEQRLMREETLSSKVRLDAVTKQWAEDHIRFN